MKKLMLVVSTIFILALALVPLASAQGGGMSLGGALTLLRVCWWRLTAAYGLSTLV